MVCGELSALRLLYCDSELSAFIAIDAFEAEEPEGGGYTIDNLTNKFRRWVMGVEYEYFWDEIVETYPSYWRGRCCSYCPCSSGDGDRMMMMSSDSASTTWRNATNRRGVVADASGSMTFWICFLLHLRCPHHGLPFVTDWPTRQPQRLQQLPALRATLCAM